MEVPLDGICCFSLVAFNIFFFVFNFCQLDCYVSWYIPPWVYPVWDSLHFLDLYCLSPLHLHFLWVFNLVSSSETHLSFISLFLTYCICGVLSAGFRIVAPLAFGVCPWWESLVLGLVQATLLEVLVPTHCLIVIYLHKCKIPVLVGPSLFFFLFQCWFSS